MPLWMLKKLKIKVIRNNFILSVMNRKKNKEGKQKQTPQEAEADRKLKAFNEGYKELCIKHGFAYTFKPVMRLGPDGSYGIVIQTHCIAIDKEGDPILDGDSK